ncbi:MAG TPA: hypothetical protein VL576_02325 [Candidatus Paceibacterota bacterium]|jgi:hypothetical protein|nr:hypothetical protein [Candidatus Paceibacterota bacterium]
MQHVAIMKKSWKLIPQIVAGHKTIESRWYQTKRAPWDRVAYGDTVYFKNSGEPVTAQASVSKVLQFELSTREEVEDIIRRYNKHIMIPDSVIQSWAGPHGDTSKLPKYCILIFLEHAKAVKPFTIDKTGFGTPCAWLCLEKFSTK